MRILLIEDDRDTADWVARGLRERGCVVDHAAHGHDGLFMASEVAYDAMIVDRMLPGVDGLTLVRMARAADITTPVLFLSAMGRIDDRVDGLEAGADDYLVKPFAFRELAARIDAVVRRRAQEGDGGEAVRLVVGELCLDRAKRTVFRGAVRIDLKPREFRLLEFLMTHAGEVVTRTMLLEQVWEFHFEPKTSVVETHVSRLRAKIDKPFETPMLETVRGAGYVLRTLE